jgi:hypothetical protein
MTSLGSMCFWPGFRIGVETTTRTISRFAGATSSRLSRASRRFAVRPAIGGGKMRDEDHIGPYNGHNKSEALPNGCAMVVLIAIGFIAVFGAYGFIADSLK